MKRILYIGNHLKGERNNVSSIHTLGTLLEGEGYQMNYASAKENKFLRLLDMVFAVVSHRNVDFIIIDTYSTLNFYFALIITQLCRLMGIEYITNLNGGNLPMRLSRNPYLSGIIFNYSSYNVAPSRYLLDAFKLFGYKRLKYIPNTIKIENYPISKKKFKQPNLLWVRSFSKIYNPKLAIRVLHNLINLGYNASLCMVGPDSDGSLKKAKKLAENLKVDVKFTGKLTKKEWTMLSQDYNIFINTTNFDNTPVSVIEAMALGLPIVSTDVGGMPYLIDNEIHGLLVKPGSVEKMTEAIERIINEENLRNNIISNARKKAESFDWDNVRHKWNVVLSTK